MELQDNWYRRYRNIRAKSLFLYTGHGQKRDACLASVQSTIYQISTIYTGQQQPHFPWLESMGGAGAGYTAATGHLHQHTNTYCE